MILKGKVRTKNIRKETHQRGITLIALVVTLVVLLILAAITINFLLGDNGIFKTANDAKIQHRIGEILDELNVAESSVSLQKLGKPTLEEYIQYIQDQNIVAEAEKQEDESYHVTTEDGYRFQISIIEGTSVNDIVIGYVGTANGPRIKAIHVTGNTTNSISVEVETANSEGATYKYEYRKDGEDDNSWKLAEESKNNTCTITGLAGNQIYDIKVTVTTSEGSATDNTSAITGELEVGTIEFEEYVWQGDGTASIVIRNNSTDPSYHLEYRIGVDGEWTEIASGEEITGLMHGQTVYGRLYDGVNEASPASVEILDETIPEEATIQLGATTANTGVNISATVTHIDNQSGVDIDNCKWVYNTQETAMGTEETDLSKYTGTFSSNGAKINLNASNPEKYYLHVLTVDKVGNAKETISDPITVTQLVTAITVSPTSITLEEGQTQKLTANITPSNASTKTVIWSSNAPTVASVNSSTGLVTAKTAGTATITAKTTDGSNKTATCSVTVKEPEIESDGSYDADKGVNTPNLIEGMTPVIWDEEANQGQGDWVKTNNVDEWYNYKTTAVNGVQAKQWANAMTEDGSMWVWIPRYAYQIETEYHTASQTGGIINIEFLKGTTNEGATGKTIVDYNATTTDDYTKFPDGYVIHPGFEYSKTVTGLWVAKFEASRSNATPNNGGDSDILKIQPEVYGWHMIVLNNAYTLCLNYDSDILSNGAYNSHLMKNSEWGAVAYLSVSEHGINDRIQKNSSFITGRSAQSYSYSDKTYGVKASTTGNIYGIYDMAGGHAEFVAAYIDNGYVKEPGTPGAASSSNRYATVKALVEGESYTKDVYVPATTIGMDDHAIYNYTANKEKYGDALYETSLEYDEAWQTNGTMGYPATYYPVFLRDNNYSTHAYRTICN